MNDYCITFAKVHDNEALDVELFHCHVTSPNEAIAIESAFRLALASNVSLSGSNAVHVRLLLPVSPELLASFETLRSAMHGGQPAAPVPPGQPLH